MNYLLIELDEYELDAARRRAIHDELWANEELDWWQRIVMSPDVLEVRR